MKHIDQDVEILIKEPHQKVDYEEFYEKNQKNLL